VNSQDRVNPYLRNIPPPFILLKIYILCLQPKVVTALDEAELVRQMERAAAENEEVAGDDDDEEEEVGQRYSEGENENGEAASGDEDPKN